MAEENKNEEVNELDEFLNADDFEEETDSEVESQGDDEDTEEEVETEKTSTETPTEEEKQKAKNAEQARKRREREAREKAQKEERERLAREAQIREEAALQAKLGVLKINPYTNEPIADKEDLEIYELQKELEDEGKDPIEDLPKRIAEANRRKAKELADAKQKEEEARNKRKASINNEITELRKKYPNVNTAELSKDSLFLEVSKGKFGRWSLTEIYEKYTEEKTKREQNKMEQENNKNVDKLVTPPSSVNKGARTSPKSVDEMTDEEFLNYYNKKYHR